MPPRGRVKIEQEAQSVLERFFITDPPIDVKGVAENLGYRVVLKFFDEEDLSGTVMRDARGVVTIGINTFHAQVRQRFSIAHEIGHACLHLARGRQEAFFVDPPAGVFFRDSKASRGEDSKEIEANQFAAALLMPSKIIGTLSHRTCRIPEKTNYRHCRFRTGNPVRRQHASYEVPIGDPRIYRA